MSLIVNALLLDPQGQPLANMDAQVYMFALLGTPKLVGSGRSGVDGRLSVSCTFTPVATADYQPRIQLRLKRGTAFVEASENPQSFNGSVCDMGNVSFNPALIVVTPNVAQFTTVPLTDLSQMRDQVTTLTQTKTTLETQLSQTTAQKTAALADLQRVQADSQAKDSIIKQKTADFANLQSAQQAESKAKEALLAQKDAALADAQARLDAVQKGEVPQIALNRLVQTTADQLKTTQEQLQQDRAGFQLGKVSLQLKVMTGNDGGQIGLPRTSDIERVGANALGQVQLDFHPSGQPAVSGSASQITVPQLAGYTELLARRKLAESKLSAEVLYQLVLSDEQTGRVVMQNPAPGTQVAPESTVMIAVGKKG